jgi:hypothetical protein
MRDSSIAPHLLGSLGIWWHGSARGIERRSFEAKLAAAIPFRPKASVPIKRVREFFGDEYVKGTQNDGDDNGLNVTTSQRHLRAPWRCENIGALPRSGS